MKQVACVLYLLCFAAGASCASQRVVEQHGSVRTKLLELYEDQIQDNLVRIKAGKAFVHLNYSEIKGLSRDTLVGKVQHGDRDVEVMGDDNLIIEGPGQDDLTLSAEGTFLNEMNLRAEPILGNIALYDAYILFADTFVRASTIRESAPKHCDCLWKREFKGTCYWMHVEDALAYRRLVLLSTLDQGKSRSLTRVEVSRSSGGKPEIKPKPTTKAGLLLYRSLSGEGKAKVIEFNDQDELNTRVTELLSETTDRSINVLIEADRMPPKDKVTEVSVIGSGLAVSVK